VVLVSPDALRMPGDIVQSLRETGHEVLESDQLEQSIAHVDIVYSTRIQEERFDSQEEADLYRGRFRLNQSIYTHHCEPNTVIMHPLPRDSRENARELDDDLNDNPNLAIFRQTDNGLLVRMALFALVLDVVDQVDRHARDVNWYTASRF
jgi:aspartate carbamoyltransferase catalytic subunit